MRTNEKDDDDDDKFLERLESNERRRDGSSHRVEVMRRADKSWYQIFDEWAMSSRSKNVQAFWNAVGVFVLMAGIIFGAWGMMTLMLWNALVATPILVFLGLWAWFRFMT